MNQGVLHFEALASVPSENQHCTAITGGTFDTVSSYMIHTQQGMPSQLRFFLNRTQNLHINALIAWEIYGCIFVFDKVKAASWEGWFTQVWSGVGLDKPIAYIYFFVSS